MIDMSVNLGHILTIILIGVGMLGSYATMKANQSMTFRQLNELRTDVNKIEDAMGDVIRQNERLNAMDERMLTQGRRIDENRQAITKLEGARFDLILDNLNRVMTTIEKR